MIKPLNGHILIEVGIKPESKFGIIRIDNEDRRLEKAKVIAIGDNVENLKKGDVVYFKTYSLSPVDIDGKEFNFIKVEELLGKD